MDGPVYLTNIGTMQSETVKYTWKIENYSSYDNKKVSDCIRSPIFADHSWYIVLYPNKKADGYISIYLSNERDVEVKASYACYIVNKAREKIKLYTLTDYSYKKKEHKESSWGLRSTLKVSDLVDQQLLVNDTLTLVFEISKEDDYFMTSGSDNRELHGFEKLLDSADFSDVTFIVQEKKIRAHKNILSVRSSVFEAMFKHGMKGNRENFVEIEDIEYGVFMELLRFIYSGKVNDMKKVALDLLIAADRYAINDLKEKCQLLLMSMIEVDKVFDYLKVADACNAPSLKAQVTEFIKEHGEDVVNMPNFAEFTQAYPLLSVTVEVTCLITSAMKLKK